MLVLRGRRTVALIGRIGNKRYSTWKATIRIPDLDLETTVTAGTLVTDVNEAADICTRFLQDHRGQVVVLTGAGVSTDSGIPDYRGEQGTYVRNPKHRPILFHEFMSSEEYRKRYWARGYLGWSQMAQAKPNPTHYALSWLLGHEYVQHIITQNVDHLHHFTSAAQQPTKVTELHGSLYSVECMDCRTVVDRPRYQHRIHARNPDWAAYQRHLILTGEKPRTNPDGDVELPNNVSYADFDIPPCHVCGSRVMKPQVVFFGESVNKDRAAFAESCVSNSRALLVIGSSLATYSSYRLVRLANDLGKPIGILNKGPTRADSLASWKAKVSCTPVMEQVCRQLDHQKTVVSFL